jgi:hypothetical protein
LGCLFMIGAHKTEKNQKPKKLKEKQNGNEKI